MGSPNPDVAVLDANSDPRLGDPDDVHSVRPADVADDRPSPLVFLGGNGWSERKHTGGPAEYWYIRWRDRTARNAKGDPIKRSKYHSRCKDNPYGPSYRA